MKPLILLSLLVLSPPQALPYWTAEGFWASDVPHTEVRIETTNLGIDVRVDGTRKYTFGYGQHEYWERRTRSEDIFGNDIPKGFDPILNWICNY